MTRRTSPFGPSVRFLLCVLIAFCFSHARLSAQTYVNKEWVRTTGLPSNLQWSASAIDTWQNVIVVGNTQVAPGNSDVLITKYDKDGIALWQRTFDGSANAEDYGVAVKIDASGNVFVAATVRSTAGQLDIALLKYADDGDLLWDTDWNGADNLDDVPTCMALDGSGNIYVGGVNTDAQSQADYVTLKLNSSGVVQWAARYDYAGFTDGITAIEINGNGDPVVTGGSASALNSWDYATIIHDASDGSELSVRRVSVPGLGLDKPLALARDGEGAFIITGYTEVSGYKDIQTVKLNADLQVVWVRDFDGDERDDVGTSVDVDEDGSVFVTGYTVKQAGGSDFITIKYDTDGNAEWQVAYRATGSGVEARASKLAVTGVGDVCVAGSVDDNGNVNFRTLLYDTDGNLRWQKTYDGYGAEDRALDVVANGSENVYVVGVVMGPNGAEYSTLRYSYFTVDNGDVFDDQDRPVCKDLEVIIRFDPQMVDHDFVDDTDLMFARLSSVIDADLYDDLETKTESNLSDALVVKIYQSMTTSQTTSTSRLGRTVQMPPMWAGLRVILPAGSQLPFVLEQVNDRTGPDPLFPRVRYAEPNWIVGLDAVVPNDAQYANAQLGLHYNSQYPAYANAHINAEGGWALNMKGNPSVDVGVFDTGILYNHEDFSFSGTNGQLGSLANTKVLGGKDYTQSTHPDIEDLSPTPDGNGHGTKAAGIIAAIRNNTIGVAGVAGGDKIDDNNTGTSLYAMKCFQDNGNAYYTYICDALFEGASIAENGTAPLDVVNNSWSIVPNTELFNALTINELKEVIRLLFEHEVLIVNSRGNTGVDELSFPSTYYTDRQTGDDWVLSVGGSGTDGEWFPGIFGVMTGANYGPQLDVIAPFTEELVQTTANVVGTYSSFSGTSSAAAFVSGLAASLMAYHPDPLAPEDVEHLIQYGAADRFTTGYDTKTGSGLIDCGASGTLIEFPDYRVVHFEAQPTAAVNITSNMFVDDFQEDYDIYPAGPQWLDVWKYTATVNHGLGEDAQLVSIAPDKPGYWVRNSGSNLWGPIEGPPGARKLIPEPDIRFEGVPTITSAVVYGYHYGVRFVPNQPVTIPYTANTGDGIPNVLAYSLLIYDPVSVGISETANGVTSSVFPNPAQTTVSMHYVLPNASVVRLSITDAIGRTVMQLDQGGKAAGEYVFQFNVAILANGVYNVDLLTDCGHEIHRVLISR